MEGNVCGQVVIVVGSANVRGIGYATVLEMIRNEAKAIVMADLNPAVVALAETLREKHPEVDVRGLVVDVAEEHDIDMLVGYTIEQFGRIDSVVHSAALNTAGTAETITYQQFERTMKVNVYSQIYLAKRVIPHMRKQGGGAFVNVSSANAFVAEKGLMPYVPSKAANASATQQMALEYASENIRFNAVAPGLLNTGFNEGHYKFLGITEQEANKDIGTVHATGKAIEPKEVAFMIVTLCSPRASAVIGANVPVEAGFSIQ